MKKSGTTLSALAITASAALLLSACSGAGGNDATRGDAGSADELTPVSLMLNWYPYGEHAPFYYGVEEGIFEAHGIDLKIEAGQGSTKTAQAVGQEQVDFGWADTPPVLSNIDNGVPIQSIGVFLQTTPSAVQVFADSGIETAEDLKGKTIAVSAGDAPTTTFPLYLEAEGLSEDDVEEQNLDAAGKIAALLSGQVDGLIGFAHDQGPTISEQSGKDMHYLRYADAGLNFYSNGLIANTATIDDDPELVQAMVDATAAAFEAAVEDPEAAAKSMDGKDPQMPSLEVLTGQWEETINLLWTEHTEGELPGTNSDEDWENTLEVLSGAGLVEEGGDVADYFDSSFAPKQ